MEYRIDMKRLRSGFFCRFRVLLVMTENAQTNNRKECVCEKQWWQTKTSSAAWVISRACFLTVRPAQNQHFLLLLQQS